MAAFTLIQMNRTNRAIAPGFVLIKSNMPSVNTPLNYQVKRCRIYSWKY